MKKISEEVKRFVSDSGLKTYVFAKLHNISRTTLSKYMSGECDYPN